MRKKLVVGNWKMHGDLGSNRQLLQSLLAAPVGVEAAVCVPFPYLAQAESLLGGSWLAWGAQNLSDQVQGAFTGEVSAAMLSDFSCSYVIVGHSERRALFGESGSLLVGKVERALSAGLTPIYCVGETLREREAGDSLRCVGEQLAPLLESLPESRWARVVLAYEPVWAIGTGRTATPEIAQEVHLALRERLAEVGAEVAATTRILYGGSVKPDNAAALFAMPDVDGALVGGASLSAEDFLAICQAAAC